MLTSSSSPPGSSTCRSRSSSLRPSGQSTHPSLLPHTHFSTPHAPMSPMCHQPRLPFLSAQPTNWPSLFVTTTQLFSRVTTPFVSHGITTHVSPRSVSYLNEAMMRFGNAQSVPLYYCTFTLASVVGAGVVYDEILCIEVWQGLLFGLGKSHTSLSHKSHTQVSHTARIVPICLAPHRSQCDRSKCDRSQCVRAHSAHLPLTTCLLASRARPRFLRSLLHRRRKATGARRRSEARGVARRLRGGGAQVSEQGGGRALGDDDQASRSLLRR